VTLESSRQFNHRYPVFCGQAAGGPGTSQPQMI
jgi:hypothetical protein